MKRLVQALFDPLKIPLKTERLPAAVQEGGHAS